MVLQYSCTKLCQAKFISSLLLIKIIGNDTACFVQGFDIQNPALRMNDFYMPDRVFALLSDLRQDFDMRKNINSTHPSFHTVRSKFDPFNIIELAIPGQGFYSIEFSGPINRFEVNDVSRKVNSFYIQAFPICLSALMS